MTGFSGNPWFSSLPQPVADALLAAAAPLRLRRGEFAYRQGESVEQTGRAFFGVAQGLLKLQILSPGGREAILAVVEPGNWVGEVAALDGTARTSSAVALTDTRLLVVGVSAFMALMQQTTFAQAIARLLAGRLRLAYGVLADSALLCTRERVARRLLLLAHGDVTRSATRRATVSTSQEVLAMMLGLSRPTLNKELQALAARGAIGLHYGRIDIKDVDMLRACSRDAG